MDLEDLEARAESVSYRRRVLQARIDLIRYELRRRQGLETEPTVEALARILSSGVEPPASPRPASPTPPEGTEGAFAYAIELSDASDTELEELIAALEAEEEKLSEERRKLYALLDGARRNRN